MAHGRTSDVGGGWEETPSVEVQVFRDGKLVYRTLCDSEDEASCVIDEWSDQEGVTFQVDDLSVRHRPGEILEPGIEETPTADYRDQVETEAQARGERKTHERS